METAQIDHDYAALRFRTKGPAAGPWQITLNAKVGTDPQLYIYQMGTSPAIPPLPPAGTPATIVTDDYKGVLNIMGAVFPLNPNTGYLLVATSNPIIGCENPLENLVYIGPAGAGYQYEYSDGAGTSIIITLEGTMSV